MKPIGILLLAAGSSSRMGRSKQQMIVLGKTLLERSVDAAAGAAAESITVVLGADSVPLQKICADRNVDFIVNANWKNGLGGSLKAGLASMLRNPTSLDAVIVMVCDQPLISSGHLDKLIEKYMTSGSPIVSSLYAHTNGVPVLFDRSFFPKLLALEDDQGAKKILMENPGLISGVEFPGGEIDFDTMADVSAFRLTHPE